MLGRREQGLQLAELLAAVEDAPPVSAADVVGQQLADAVGATEVAFLIADLSGGSLVRLGRAGPEDDAAETGTSVPLAGTPHGRAIVEQAVQVEDDGDSARVYAPVTNRGEAIGVLELSLPHPPDPETVADVGAAAHALAYIVVANRRFTDLFEWGKRSVPLSLAAEIQHRLLPGSYTCEAGQFTIAGWLEPAGNVGGDTFDFSIARDTLHLSITDAMGHTVESAVLATVLVGALRNARRADDANGLAAQVQRADAGLAAFVDPGAFLTGQVARVDLATGSAQIVNAGHPLPLRLRDGRVEEVELEAEPPFAAIPGHRYRVQELPLQPGDRLVFLTDGVLERQAGRVDIKTVIEASADDHPREAVQRLVQAVLDATGGDLEDDATVLCLDWHGGPPRDRTTRGGSNVAA